MIQVIKGDSLREVIMAANQLGISQKDIIQILPLKNETEFYLVYTETRNDGQ